MKITSLIPSKTVAEYLEKQNYEFSVLESAYVIAISNKLSVREKHAEWKHLSKSLKDCEVFDGTGLRHYESLFDVLEKIIELQNHYIELFFQEEEGIYRLYEVIRDGQSEWLNGNPKHTLYECTHPVEIENRQGVQFIVNKQQFNSGIMIHVKLNGLDEVLELHVSDAPQGDENYLDFFNGIGLSFPLPFKVGDIVYEVGSGGVDPMVVKGISNCGRQQVCCVTVHDDDSTYDGWISNVLSLERYEKPLSESKMKLKELSEQLKTK